jgi:drug/metabolite transporter (DMT)-like permease
MAANNKVIIYIEALLAVVIWGGTFIATKVTLREVSPATIVWLRFAIGIIILGIAVAARKQFALPARKELGYFALLGFIGVTLHQWLQATGLITAAATTTAWIVATIPVFSALLGWLILKEKLGLVRVGGMVLAAVGVILIVSKGEPWSFLAGSFGTFGDFLILISSVNWAVFSVLSRRGLQAHPATRMMFYVMVFGWLFANIWLFGFGPGLSEIPQLTIDGWGGIFVLGILGSGLAYIAWYDALQAIPASQLAAFINIEPLITTAMAAFILGETISLFSILGAALIIAGVYLVNQPDKNERGSPVPVLQTEIPD